MSRRRSSGFCLSKTTHVTEKMLSGYLQIVVTEDLRSVPCIGPAYADRLEGAGIETTQQLLGKFLSFKGRGVTIQEHCDAFYFFLKDCEIKTHAGAITLAVAEKVNVMIPGIFDASQVKD